MSCCATAMSDILKLTPLLLWSAAILGKSAPSGTGRSSVSAVKVGAGSSFVARPMWASTSPSSRHGSAFPVGDERLAGFAGLLLEIGEQRGIRDEQIRAIFRTAQSDARPAAPAH